MPNQNPQEPFARVTVDEAKEMMTREDVTVVDVRDPMSTVPAMCREPATYP